MSLIFTHNLALSAGLPEDRFPETLEEANMVQEILTRELNNMSLDDHEKVVFDVHGIAHVPKEDPEILQEQLERLKVELDRVTGNEAYLKVNKINPEFANQYRLMFLRGEKYDVTLASKKLVQHFDVKRQLFGEGPIMTRDIRQSDLSPNGKRILESGFMQASNERDSSGRAIVFMTSQYHKDGITALDLVSELYKDLIDQMSFTHLVALSGSKLWAGSVNSLLWNEDIERRRDPAQRNGLGLL